MEAIEKALIDSLLEKFMTQRKKQFWIRLFVNDSQLKEWVSNEILFPSRDMKVVELGFEISRESSTNKIQKTWNLHEWKFHTFFALTVHENWDQQQKPKDKIPR